MESELRAYHRLYAERFVLRERRPAARRRVTSSPSAPEPDDPEVWFDEAAVKIHQAEVAKTLGCPEGVLALASYSLPPTYPGLVGAPALPADGHPGPAAIVLVYAGPAGAAPLDRRLYLPETWFHEDRLAPNVAWSVPAWVTYQTGLTLGTEMVRAVLAGGRMPARGVILDQAYSHAWRFLDELHQVGQTFCVTVNRTHPFWRQAPAQAGGWETGRVDFLAARLPGEAWHAAGDEEVMAQRIILDRRGQPGPEGWLLARRPAGSPAVDGWQFCLSNAPADTAPGLLAEWMTWQAAVAAVLDDCRTEAGDAAPGWAGWHHHTTLTMVAHHFLLQLRRRFGAAAPALNLPQARRLLEAVLLRPEFDIWPAVAEIEHIQSQNLAAYCAPEFDEAMPALAEALCEPWPAI
jgi:hypothetical protein